MSTTQEQESPYEIGVAVSCTDGDCGELHRILIDPASRAIAHLVIGKDVHSARLVPVALVDHAHADGIRLICTTLDFDRLEPAEATEVIQPPSPPTASLPTNGGALGGYGGRAQPEAGTHRRL